MYIKVETLWSYCFKKHLPCVRCQVARFGSHVPVQTAFPMDTAAMKLFGINDSVRNDRMNALDKWLREVRGCMCGCVCVCVCGELGTVALYIRTYYYFLNIFSHKCRLLLKSRWLWIHVWWLWCLSAEQSSNFSKWIIIFLVAWADRAAAITATIGGVQWHRAAQITSI